MKIGNKNKWNVESHYITSEILFAERRAWRYVTAEFRGENFRVCRGRERRKLSPFLFDRTYVDRRSITVSGFDPRGGKVHRLDRKPSFDVGVLAQVAATRLCRVRTHTYACCVCVCIGSSLLA